MQIGSVSQAPLAALASPVTAGKVSAAALQRANSDGDGRSGAAALNDGDAAAAAAAQQAKSASHVDIKV